MDTQQNAQCLRDVRAGAAETQNGMSDTPEASKGASGGTQALEWWPVYCERHVYERCMIYVEAPSFQQAGRIAEECIQDGNPRQVPWELAEVEDWGANPITGANREYFLGPCHVDQTVEQEVAHARNLEREGTAGYLVVEEREPDDDDLVTVTLARMYWQDILDDLAARGGVLYAQDTDFVAMRIKDALGVGDVGES